MLHALTVHGTRHPPRYQDKILKIRVINQAVSCRLFVRRVVRFMVIKMAQGKVFIRGLRFPRRLSCHECTVFFCLTQDNKMALRGASRRCFVPSEMSLSQTAAVCHIWTQNTFRWQTVKTVRISYSKFNDMPGAWQKAGLSHASTTRWVSFIVSFRSTKQLDSEKCTVKSLGTWPTWCTIKLYNTIIIVILYMFRATLCSLSGQIALIQHLV